MKRKLLISLLSVACASCCAIGLAACDKEPATPPNLGGPNTGDGPTYIVPEKQEDTNLAYEPNSDGNYTITGSGTETKTDIVIPSMIGDIPVTEIADGAFASRTDITGVTISDGITHIGAGAFSNCTGLKSIRIPDTVVTVGENVFMNCTELLAVVFGEGLTVISDSMFEGCVNLKTANIPDNVTYIGESAFQNCTTLNTVKMGSGVLKIGYRAFYSCTSLKAIEVGSSVTELGNGVFQGCTALERVVVPNSVRYIGTNMIAECNKIKTIQVPFIGAFRYNDPPEHLIPDEDEENDGTTLPGIIDINDPTTYGFFGYFLGATSNYDTRQFTYGILSNVTVIITDSSPITNGSFNDTFGVTTIIIKGEMTEIMSQGLAFMWDLKTLVLPKSMKTIRDAVFYSTSTLQTVYYTGTQSDWSGISISNDQNYALSSATKYYNGQWNYDSNGLPKPI